MSSRNLEMLLADLFGSAVEPTTPVAIDSVLVAKLADALLVDPRELTLAIRVLVDRYAGAAPAYEIRTGGWRIDLVPAAARAVVVGAVAASVMWLMGINDVPVAILSAVASLLFSIRSVEVDASEVMLHAQLIKAGDQPRMLRELHNALPSDMRAELSIGELADIVERFHRVGLARWTEQGITITAPGGRRALRLTFSEPSFGAVAAQVVDRLDEPVEASVDASRKVFVVHGRDSDVQNRMFDFLRALHLDPQEWEPLVNATGSTLPFLHEVVARGLAPGSAQAVVVLLTPDDIVTLHPALQDSSDPIDETSPMLQPRPNVLIELGMALSAYRDRTIIVEIGRRRRIADLDGLNVIRFDGSDIAIGKLVERLKLAGCTVNDKGSDWRRTNRFAGLDAYNRAPPADWTD